MQRVGHGVKAAVTPGGVSTTWKNRNCALRPVKAMHTWLDLQKFLSCHKERAQGNQLRSWTTPERFTGWSQRAVGRTRHWFGLNFILMQWTTPFSILTNKSLWSYLLFPLVLPFFFYYYYYCCHVPCPVIRKLEKFPSPVLCTLPYSTPPEMLLGKDDS